MTFLKTGFNMTSLSKNIPRFHYAFVIAVVTFFVLLVSAGVRNVSTVLITPLEKEFAWSRSSISFAIAVSLLWFGLGGPLSGSLVDRFGPRRVMLGGLGLIASGLTAMLWMNTLWMFHLLWGVAVGIGTGAVANVLGATIAHRWFNAHRGLIIGLFGATSAAGQLIFLPLLINLTTVQGWRGGLTVVAIIIGVMLIPILLFMRDDPSQMNTHAYGDDGTRAGAVTELVGRTPLSAAIRTRDFWLLAISFFICGYTTNGLIGTHLLPHTIEHGFNPAMTASALGVMGMMNIIGTLASGWLSDRFDNRKLLATYYGLRAVAIVGIPFIADVPSFVVFAILYGLDWVATVPPTVNLTAMRFGRASLGTLYGWIFCSHMVGAALAAYLGGVMRETFGDYTLAFYSAALLGFMAAAFSMSVSSRERMQELTVVAGD